MADWSHPVLTDLYTDVLTTYLNGRLNDCGTLFNTAPSNQPDHVIRFLRSPGLFQEWLSATWNPLLLDVTGGGTGASTASGARTNLGLGTMSTQSAAAVAITGGTESGVTIDNTNNIDAGAITSGTVATARLPTAFQSGMMVMYGGAAAPSGWVLCDGSAISRTTFSILFGVIGTAYGIGDGSTTFNVPDLRQKFPLGTATSGTGSTLGGSGGSIDHTHTSAAHTHTSAAHVHGTSVITVPHSHTISGTHTHGVSINVNSGVESFDSATGILGGGLNVAGINHVHLVSVVGTTAASSPGSTDSASPGLSGSTDSTTPGSTGSTTPGVTGTNNPPFCVVNYIIKT
jgi:microcystin-dependent protein